MSREYFTEIKSEISGQEDSIAVANIVLTKILRLRQITSGFITDANGNAVPVTQSNPKINALLDIVEQCGNEQIIIWCQFRWEIAQILTHLEKIAGVSQLHGGIKESDRINHVNDFISGKNRFLLAHPASATSCQRQSDRPVSHRRRLSGVGATRRA